jgi:hypothetical protein
MNPWSNLPSNEPYVLPLDGPPIEVFNRRAKANHVIHLEVVPEPFLGDPIAPVVLLNLNPGYVEDDREVHHDPAFNVAARANLLHAHTAWPLYLLDPSLPSPGQDWWRKKLAALIAAVGSMHVVASRVFVAEVHGYHSRRFHHGLRIPSQRYTFSLVEDAIERGAKIVAMRGMHVWLREVPRLASVPLIQLRNPQNPCISPRNCPESFDEIARAVRGAA